MKKNSKILFLVICLFVFTSLQRLYCQSYASLPFFDGFEADWINSGGIRDVPSIYWKNTPVTTDSSWSRDDDGELRRAWRQNIAGYTPSGAFRTSHSARFHSYDALVGTTGKLDLYINLSTYSDTKTLTFWHINYYGPDKLEVFLSTNGGLTFGNALTTVVANSVWTKVTVDLGTISSSTCVIRFKGTGDYGGSDIGIDNVSVTTPTTPVTANFITDKTIGVGSAFVSFYNNSSANATAFKWYFNNVTTPDATSENAMYKFTTPGTYTVKLTSTATNADSITKYDLITIIPQPYATLPFSESFDSIWINRDSIRDVPTLYFKNSPSVGDRTWARNDDIYGKWVNYIGGNQNAFIGANFTSHWARFNSYNYKKTGNLDAYINFSTQTGNKTLTFWYINKSAFNGLEVLYSTDGGTNFTSLDTIYNIPEWSRFAYELGNINSTTGVIRFKAYGNYYNPFDIGLDEIHVENPLISPVIANISADTLIGEKPLLVHFEDNSYGAPTEWEWDFDNNGIVDSITQNPSFTFNELGVYTVKLKASKNGSSDTVVRTNLIKVDGYLPLPLDETFESEWISKDYNRDVPAIYANNTPATGNNSWSRNDDGYNRGAWYNSYGAYNPTGAENSLHSARIHSYNSNQIGILDFKLDFSNVAGNKTLSFWYINMNGNDSLKVYLSTNEGTNFGSALVSLDTSKTWKKITINLGNITTTKGVLRFRAKCDNGNSDIGIDQIYLDITGENKVVADFEADVLQGASPLTVNFTDLSTGTPTGWKWDFDNDGKVDDTSQNPSYTYKNAGFYTVKFTALRNSSYSEITKTAYIQVRAFDSITFTENFDSVWIDKLDNRDVPTINADNKPATGYNSWSRSDDGLLRGAWSEDGGEYFPAGAGGTGYSARFHSTSTTDTGTLDFAINFSKPGRKSLSFWYINANGTDKLNVYLSTDNGQTFGKPLKSYNTAEKWKNQVLNLGRSANSACIVRFEAIGDNGSSDIGLDNIQITIAPNSTDVDASISQNNKLFVYPNPSDGKLCIEIDPELAVKTISIEILDVSGKLISTIQSYNENLVRFDLSGNKPGIYFIRAIAGNEIYNCKFSIQ